MYNNNQEKIINQDYVIKDQNHIAKKNYLDNNINHHKSLEFNRDISQNYNTKTLDLDDKNWNFQYYNNKNEFN